MLKYIRDVCSFCQDCLIEAVSRYLDPQLQVGENYSYVFHREQTFANADD